MLLLGSPWLRAQTTTPDAPCPPVKDAQGNLVSSSTCAPTTPQAPATKRFPFPGETTPDSAPPAAATPSPDGATAPAPQAPASKRFPFPGEEGTEPNTAGQTAPANNGDGATSARTPLQDAGSSGESSSSSSSNSSGAADAPGRGDAASSSSASRNSAGGSEDPDANDPAAIPRRDRHKKPPTPRQTPSQREQEDVQVAGFYFNDGNFKGSYDRALDAVSLDGEDAAAQLALGNAARKLGKLDEAEKAYRQCLDLDPVPKVRKPAEKALREMTGNE